MARNVNLNIDALLGDDIRMKRENRLNARNPFSNPTTFLYQAGHLTLKDYYDDTQEYLLQVPNGEVRDSLTAHLAAYSLDMEEEQARKFRNGLCSSFNKGRVDDLIALLNDYLFYQGNCMTMGNKELYFHNTLVTVFSITGYTVEVERHTAKSRADLMVKSNKYIYVMELKWNATAQAALDQINHNGYADPYRADPRNVVKLGLNLSEEEHIIDNYAFETAEPKP